MDPGISCIHTQTSTIRYMHSVMTTRTHLSLMVTLLVESTLRNTVPKKGTSMADATFHYDSNKNSTGSVTSFHTHNCPVKWILKFFPFQRGKSQGSGQLNDLPGRTASTSWSEIPVTPKFCGVTWDPGFVREAPAMSAHPASQMSEKEKLRIVIQFKNHLFLSASLSTPSQGQVLSRYYCICCGQALSIRDNVG